jgi:hypothetical protein
MMSESTETSRKVAVSDGNLRKSARRLLHQDLVSTEVNYIKHVLGASAPQLTIDRTIVEVRGMPWASIVLPD